jgi:hypothetical protein
MDFGQRGLKMCECFQIGGPFIAEDPDCEAHGWEAQERQKEIERKAEQVDNFYKGLEIELAVWKSHFPQYEYRIQDECIALKLN